MPAMLASQSLDQGGVRQMMHILLVDDDALTSEVIEDILKNLRHSVVVVRDADSAIQRLDSETFDVVITDYQMPGKSGLAVVEYASLKNVPAILVSGVGLDRLQSLTQGMRVFALIDRFELNRPLLESLLRQLVKE